MPSSCASSVSSSRPPPATSASAPVRQPGALGRLARDPRQHGVGVRRGRGAAQQHRVARLQAQRGGVDRDVRARLVDDGDHAERDSNLAELEPVGQAAAVDDLADRVRQRRDRPRAVGDRARRAPRPAPADPSARRRDPTRGPPRDRARWPRGSPGCAPRARRRSRAAPRPSSPTVDRRQPPRGGLGGEREIGHGRGRCERRLRPWGKSRLSRTHDHDPPRPGGPHAARPVPPRGRARDLRRRRGRVRRRHDPRHRRRSRAVSAAHPTPRCSTAATASCCPGSSTPTSTSRRSPSSARWACSCSTGSRQRTLPEEARMADAVHARRTAQRFVGALASNGTTTALVFGAHFPDAQQALFEEAERARAADHERARGLRPQPARRPRGHARRRLRDEPSRCASAGTAAAACATRSRRASASPAPRRCSTPAARCWTRRRPRCSPATSTRARARSTSCASCSPTARDYLDTYERAGLLGECSVLAHNVHVSDDELRRLARVADGGRALPVVERLPGLGHLPDGAPRRARRALRDGHRRRRGNRAEHAQGGPRRLPRADGPRPGPHARPGAPAVAGDRGGRRARSATR